MKLPEGFAFSQSNLQDFVDCSYRFYLKNILHAKWPALVVDNAIDFENHSLAGARFHQLIQQYLIGIPEPILNKLAAVDKETHLYEWWEQFLLHVPPKLIGEKYPEMLLSSHLNGYRLIAKYDLILILKDAPEMIIFDWKTSHNKPKEAWLLERIQTRMYRFILAQSGAPLINQEYIKPEKITMRYWYSQFPETLIQLPYDTVTFEEDLAYFSSLIENILSKPKEAFIKTSNWKKCRYCIYRSYCDRGVEAGDIADFDDWEQEDGEENLISDFNAIPEIEF